MTKMIRRHVPPSRAVRFRDDRLQPEQPLASEVAAHELIGFLRRKLQAYPQGSLCRERLAEIIHDLEQDSQAAR